MPRKKSKLQLEIDRVYASMHDYNPDDPEFVKHIELLDRLNKLDHNNGRERLSINTAMVVLGNLAVVGVVIAYEQHHVITTKALSFIRR